MKDKYLPVGTIVLLDGAKKKLMITGFCIVAENNTEKMYDYSGCLYPEGIISADQTALFNHNQIKEIIFDGYEDEEEKEFKSKLKSAIESL